MPYIKVETNASVEDTGLFLEKLSAQSAKILGKPEQYIMATFHKTPAMFFAGSDLPAVFIECKSIGLPETQTGNISKALCSFCEAELDVPANRVYIEFSNASGPMWGFNNGTF